MPTQNLLSLSTFFTFYLPEPAIDLPEINRLQYNYSKLKILVCNNKLF